MFNVVYWRERSAQSFDDRETLVVELKKNYIQIPLHMDSNT
jgi:hypothetical protein